MTKPDCNGDDKTIKPENISIASLKKKVQTLEGRLSIYKKEGQAQKQSNAFESLISKFSARFISLPNHLIDAEIEQGLEQIALFLKADRCALVEFSENGSQLTSTHVFARQGVRPFRNIKMGQRLPYYVNSLLEGNTIQCSSEADIPEEAEHERKFFKDSRAKNFLATPLSIGGDIHFAVTITFFQEIISPHHIPRQLKLFGEILANALMRKRSRDKLEAAFDEINALNQQLAAENHYLKEAIEINYTVGEITGKSQAIRQVFVQISQVAKTDATVLIMGDTGTGKELIAREIHRQSSRNERPMIAVNCAALPSSLIENELFGREKGAFTGADTDQAGRFELADHSTLFLDEVGELPLPLQAKLLRVLQEGLFERLGASKTIHVDVRIVAATNRDLLQAVKAGDFRSDLYYRLNVFPIKVPPLQARIEDIPLMIWQFVREFEEKMGKTIRTIPAKTMEALQQYPWPGNVRELRNVIEYAMIISTGNVLSVQIPSLPDSENQGGMALREVERRHILKVLEQTGWRIKGKNGAAEILDLPPSTLRSKMEKLGVVKS